MSAARPAPKPKRHLLNGPTILTLLRIVLVVPVMICIFLPGLPTAVVTIVCFIVASATDFIDGRWARRHHLVTDLGAFLDPLADKMLVNLTFLALVMLGVVPLFVFAIILIRDFAVDGVRMLAAKANITIAASVFGKTKTLSQMLAILFLLIGRAFALVAISTVGYVLLVAATAFTVFSGLDYLIKSWRLLTKSSS